MTLAFGRVFGERPRGLLAGFWLLASIWALLPLFIWPAAYESFLVPKWTLLAVGTWVVLGAVVIQSAFGEKIAIPIHPVNAFLACFLAWQTVSAIWSAAPALAWDQVRSTVCLVVFTLLAQSLVAGRRNRFLALVWILIGTSSILAGWAIVLDFVNAFAPGSLAFRQTLGDWRDAVSMASLGNTGHLADFVVMGFLALMGMAVSTRSRRALWVCAVLLWLHAAALIVCWSVHSNLSLIVAAGLLAYLLKDRLEEPGMKTRLLRRGGLLTAGWGAIVLFFVISHPLNPHGAQVWGGNSPEAEGGIFHQAFSSDRWKAGGVTRLAIWYTTLEIVRENPWLGTGAGTFTYVYPATQSELVLNDPDLAPYSGMWTNAAHNSLLQTWSELGIVGIFLLIGLVGVTAHELNRRRTEDSPGNAVVASVALAMLAAFCIQAQMNFPLETPVSSVLFFLLVSVPAVLPWRTGLADLLLPVQRSFGPFRVGIMLKNMRVPTEIHLGWSATGAVRMGTAAAIGIGVIAAACTATDTLRASVLYRPVYEGKNRPELLQSSAGADRLISMAKRVLEVDPGYADCRSALTDIQVRTGRYEEALEQLPILKKRLNSYEVYLREAISLEATGRGEEALDAWETVFLRRPSLINQYPGQYGRVAARWRAGEASK